MGDTAIEWTDTTWNPVTGCSKVSPGCANCYAERVTKRFQSGEGAWKFKPWTPENAAENVVLHPERMSAPRRWKKHRRVFVNSMSDLFHENVPDGFIAWVWMTMSQTHHTYQVLTKRPERMLDFVTRWNDLTGENFSDFKNARGPDATRAAHPSGRGQLYAAYLEELGKTTGGEPPEGCAWPTFDWMEGPMRWGRRPLFNVWLGVSVENQHWADERIPTLLQTPARVRFLSIEPMLGPIDLQGPVDGTFTAEYPNLGLHWVIAGGESGGPPDRQLVEQVSECVSYDRISGSKHTRLWKPKPEALRWVQDLRDQCLGYGIPFFFKQWGGPRPTSGGREIYGREWNEFPGVKVGA